MDKLLLTLTLLAFSSGVLCNAEQNLTDTANSTLAPMGIMNNNENVYSASAELKPTRQSSIRCNNVNGCCSGDIGTPMHRLHKLPKTWNEARISCLTAGGQLVVINSNEEATMLADWLRKEDIEVAWMGAHDLFKNTDWVTLTGETLEAAGYDNWSTNEPNNWGGEKHCGGITMGSYVTNRQCDNLQSYFCKIYKC